MAPLFSPRRPPRPLGEQMAELAAGFRAGAADEGWSIGVTVEGAGPLDGLVEALLAHRPGRRLRRTLVSAIGAHVGEVIRAAVGGEWVGEGRRPEHYLLRLPSGVVLRPLEQARQRLDEGEAYALEPYVAAAVAAEHREFPNP